MTQRTRLIILCTVFVVLLATYIVGSMRIQRAGGSPEAGEPLVSQAVVSDSRTIRLTRGPAGGENGGAAASSSATVLRARSGGGWSVRIDDGLFPAHGARVDGFLEALAGLRTIRIAARGEEYFDEFGLGDDEARAAVLLDGDGEELTRILFGGVATGGGRMYARVAGTTEVRIVDGDIGSYLGRQPSYWSDLRPLPEDLTAPRVTRLSVEANLQIDPESLFIDRFTVFREPGGGGGGSRWRMDTSDGNRREELEQDDVEAWARRVTELEASAFVADPPADAGLADPRALLVVEDEGGRSYELRIGATAGDGRYYMRVEGPGVDTADDGEPYLYTVSAAQIRRVLRNRDAIVASADVG